MIEREQVHVIAQQKWHNLVDLVGVCVCEFEHANSYYRRAQHEIVHIYAISYE